MRLSSRRTRVLGWLLAASGALCGVVLLVSLSYAARLEIASHTRIELGAGMMRVFHISSEESIGHSIGDRHTAVDPNESPTGWWLSFTHSPSRAIAIGAPLWVFLLLLAGPGVLLLYRTRHIARPRPAWLRFSTYRRSPVGVSFLLLVVFVVFVAHLSVSRVFGVTLTSNSALVCNSGSLKLVTAAPSALQIDWAAQAGEKPSTLRQHLADGHADKVLFAKFTRDWEVTGMLFNLSSVIRLPLWVAALALLALGVLVLVRANRARPGLCPHCRYNLAGLPPGSPCPECGRAAPQKGA